MGTHIVSLGVARGIASPRELSSHRIGRPALWSENMQARFEAGTFARIAQVLGKGECRTDFVRDAVNREIARRSGQTD